MAALTDSASDQEILVRHARRHATGSRAHHGGSSFRTAARPTPAKFWRHDPPRRLVIRWRNECTADSRQRAIRAARRSRDGRYYPNFGGKAVKLTVTHDDFEAAQGTPGDRGDQSGGWPLVLSSLKSSSRTGEHRASTSRLELRALSDGEALPCAAQGRLARFFKALALSSAAQVVARQLDRRRLHDVVELRQLVALAIGAVTPGRAISQASATCAGVAPWRAATSSSAARMREAARVEIAACMPAAARRRFCRVGGGAVFAGEEAGGERVIGDDADALPRGRSARNRSRIPCGRRDYRAAAGSRSAGCRAACWPRARPSAAPAPYWRRRSRAPCPARSAAHRPASVSSTGVTSSSKCV